jgi:hypothetical protein
MKSIFQVRLLLAVLLLTTGAVLLLAERPRPTFPIYDNMFYKRKPDTAMSGLIPSNILYEDKIWPSHQGAGTLPNHDTFLALVRAATTNPGPLVIDIESVSVRVSPDIARRNAEMLAELADWARQAAPGKVIGYYGTNTLSDIPEANFAIARALAQHVDAFFPPTYTFDDDRSRWEKRAEHVSDEARQLASNKPVYFYLCPQYHFGSGKAFRYVTADYWKFQLETSHRYADGIVIWSSSSYVWDDSTGWWDATQQFAESLRLTK